MADETTTATEGQPAAAAAATTAQASPTGGAATGGARPEPLPKLRIGSNETSWVLYLQQMLNYHYQSQVVAETGDYDSQTAGAVEHFRSQQHIEGTDVDKDVWDKLGVQDPAEAWDKAHPQGAGGGQKQGNQKQGNQKQGAQQHGAQHGNQQHGNQQHGQQHGDQQHGGHHGGQQHADGQHGQQAEAYAPLYHNVQLVAATNDGACWAAAMAMVLNLKGGSHSVESVCQQAQIDANDRKSASDVRSIGPQLGLQQVVCNGATPAGWAQALAYGPLWAANPMNDTNVLVIAGVSGTGAEAIIHVMDPVSNLDQWMNFDQFIQHYGFSDYHELLA